MIRLLFAAFLLTILSQSQSFVDERPNIVFIMADDLGLGDVSYYNESILEKRAILSTPAMDDLARNGMSFSDAHSATAFCSPTQYCVMSGNMKNLKT